MPGSPNAILSLPAEADRWPRHVMGPGSGGPAIKHTRTSSCRRGRCRVDVRDPIHTKPNQRARVTEEASGAAPPRIPGRWQRGERKQPERVCRSLSPRCLCTRGPRALSIPVKPSGQTLRKRSRIHRGGTCGDGLLLCPTAPFCFCFVVIECLSWGPVYAGR